MNKGRTYSFPVAVREFDEYSKAVEARDAFETVYSKLISKFKERSEAIALAADKLNNQLLSLADEIPISDEIFEKALKRSKLGNPPGKDKNTIGDETNWECLMEFFDGRIDDLHLVSADGDYASELNPKRLKPILQRDWEKATILSSIHLYGSLSEFFKSHFPEIKLASEVELHLYIDQLIDSRSFSRTHDLVAKILSLNELSLGACKRIVDAAQSNNQVGWIATDRDLFDLFSTIYDEFEDSIGAERRQYLEQVISEGKRIWSENPDDADEIPF